MKNITAILLCIQISILAYSQNTIGITVIPQISEQLSVKRGNVGLGFGGVYQHSLSDKVKIESGLMMNLQQGRLICDSISGLPIFSVCHGDKKEKISHLQVPLLLKITTPSKSPTSFIFSIGTQVNYFIEGISTINHFSVYKPFFLRGIVTSGASFKLKNDYYLQIELTYARTLSIVQKFYEMKEQQSFNFFGLKLNIIKEL